LNIIPKVIDIFHGDKVTDFSKARAFGIRGVIHKATKAVPSLIALTDRGANWPAAPACCGVLTILSGRGT
jgi:hypothetical protein